MKAYVLRVQVEQDEDGRWSAFVPDLPGCGSWGHTQEEALANLQEEAQAYIEVLHEKGQALPPQAVVAEVPGRALLVSV